MPIDMTISISKTMSNFTAIIPGARNDRGMRKAPRVAINSRPLADSTSEYPSSLEHTRNNTISYGRKFLYDMYDRVERESPDFSKLVTWENFNMIVLLVLVVGTMWFVYRLVQNHRKRVLMRINNVIKISEDYLVSKTRIKVQYSTEYSSLTFDAVSELFDKGCVIVRRDGRTPNDRSYELTSKTWRETLGIDDISPVNLNMASNIPIEATWHAIWNRPPPVEVGLWDCQAKTQKISYDVISLDRSTENRRKIEYHCVADHGLSSGWIKFFYEVNDGKHNFLRDWTESKYKNLVRGYLIMYPPNYKRDHMDLGSWIPVLVPDPVKHEDDYKEMHRIRLIADKITITMRPDGSWNEAAFRSTYRNVVSGNTQISIGHQLTDQAMKTYLPLVRKIVKANWIDEDRE